MAEQAGCEEVDGNITEILSYTDKNYWVKTLWY
jgi:hypothetical protein